MAPGECYRICPTQDPYQGDQYAEAMDHEFNAQYDDVRERYAATAADADMFFENEREQAYADLDEAEYQFEEEKDPFAGEFEVFHDNGDIPF